jgi:hypothetical protein
MSKLWKKDDTRLVEKGPPTENEVFGCKLADWNHPMLSLSYN